MAFYVTPNMLLKEPNVLGEPGPIWAQDLNSSLTLIDSHNHTSGQGVQVPTAGININAALSFNGFSYTNVSFGQFAVNASAIGAGLASGAVYVATVAGRNELFYQDSTGANVQITSTGAVNQSGTSIASNGFTGSGYNTASGAAAIWNSAGNFYSFTTNGSTLASIAAANEYVYGALTLAAAGSGVTPSQGFSQSGTTTDWLLTYDGGTGTFSNTALDYYTTGKTLRVNPIGTMTVPTISSSLDVYNSASTGALPLVTQRLISNFTTVANGQGPALEFWTNTSLTAQVPLGYIGGLGNASSAGRGVVIQASYGGTYPTLTAPPFQVLGVSSTQAGVTMFAPAVVQANGLTMGGNILPYTTNTYTLGGTSNLWNNIYSNTLTGGAGLTIGTAVGTNLITTESDAGVDVRNQANTAWAQLTAGNITANGSLSATGALSATAATISGNTTITGNLTVNGSITSTSGSPVTLRASGVLAVGSAGTITIGSPLGLAPSTASQSADNTPTTSWRKFTFSLTAAIPGANRPQMLISIASASGTDTAMSAGHYLVAPIVFIASDRQSCTIWYNAGGGGFTTDYWLDFQVYA